MNVIHPLCLLASACVLLSLPVAGQPRHFAWDSLGGTLARDHQSRAIYHEGKHRRTYVAYMDHSFYARITYYDHDKKSWVYPPVLLDDCIRPDHRFNHANKDGHNVPNLFVTRDGAIHVFYGAHGTAFRYARTKEPEDIRHENWVLDGRVGKQGTYPYFAQTQDSTLYVFYRYSPTGGYNNPFFAMQSTRDNGKTWSELVKLATFPEASKIHRGVYDPVRDRIHFLIHPRGPLGGRWGNVHCIYDPKGGKLLSASERVLGPMGTVRTFKEGLPKIFWRMADFVLHNGKPYFLYQGRKSGILFGYWEDDKWIEWPVAGGVMDGLARPPVMHTPDGQNFKVFGVTNWDTRKEQGRGGDITMWQSADGGRSWSKGAVVAGREQFGHGFQELNKVMGYSGAGPLFIAAEPTSAWPKGWKKTVYTHYDNPSRRDKKLYAFDVDGDLIRR